MKRVFLGKCIAALLLVLPSVCGFAQSWTQVPSPNPSTERNLLRGISGTSSSDVWAVGHYQPNPANYVYHNLIIHWNGTSFQTVPIGNPSADNNDLWDVQAISPNVAWAVGDYTYPGSTANAQIHKWNGTSWIQQTIPTIAGGSYLFGIGAVSASDIWAVGGKAGSPFLCYAMHYNGSSWAEVAVPPAPGSGRNNFNAVHGLSANDVWAVGTWGANVGDYHFLAMHWNGSTWTNSPIPNTVNNGVDGELLDVKMVSANDVWAVGYSLAGGIVMLHWNGTVWSQVPTTGGGGALAVLSANDIYAVGSEIAHWNGSRWTVVDTLFNYPYPALGAATVLPGGEIWAAGRTVDSNNIFKTLVYRKGSNISSTVAGITRSTFAASVYPNPFSKDISLSITSEKSSTISLQLTDAFGRLKYAHSIELRQGVNEVPILTSPDMSSGIYLLTIADGNTQQVIKLYRK